MIAHTPMLACGHGIHRGFYGLRQGLWFRVGGLGVCFQGLHRLSGLDLKILG